MYTGYGNGADAIDRVQHSARAAAARCAWHGRGNGAYEAQENQLHHELIRQKAELDGAIIKLQAENEELKLKLRQHFSAASFAADFK